MTEKMSLSFLNKKTMINNLRKQKQSDKIKMIEESKKSCDRKNMLKRNVIIRVEILK